jgi:hypothetical protein
MCNYEVIGGKNYCYWVSFCRCFIYRWRERGRADDKLSSITHARCQPAAGNARSFAYVKGLFALVNDLIVGRRSTFNIGHASNSPNDMVNLTRPAGVTSCKEG